MRYNVLIKDSLVTVCDCCEGISQPLFDKGVRIHHHDLPKWEALEIAASMVDNTFFVDYNKFKAEVLKNTDLTREPMVAWSSHRETKLTYDNLHDTRKVY